MKFGHRFTTGILTCSALLALVALEVEEARGERRLLSRRSVSRKLAWFGPMPLGGDAPNSITDGLRFTADGPDARILIAAPGWLEADGILSELYPRFDDVSVLPYETFSQHREWVMLETYPGLVIDPGIWDYQCTVFNADEVPAGSMIHHEDFETAPGDGWTFVDPQWIWSDGRIVLDYEFEDTTPRTAQLDVSGLVAGVDYQVFLQWWAWGPEEVDWETVTIFDVDILGSDLVGAESATWGGIKTIYR